MLQVQSLRKSYGATRVLEDVSFVVNRGERVALIGPNGAGKSTILRCITGAERPDAGSVAVAPGTRSGYLAQTLEAAAGRTVGDLLAGAGTPFAVATATLAHATEALARDPGATATSGYEVALAAFEALGGYEREHRADAVAHGLGLGHIDRGAAVDTLSGGQKTRLGLALLLVDEPELLLLDEPTNHLDVEALAWLEAFLRGYRGAILAVSHDREFLDNTVTRTLYLDPKTRSVRSYEGAYTAFATARAAEREQHTETWRRQEEYVARVRSNVARLKGEALAVELATTPRQPGVRKLAKRKAKLGKAREHKLDRYLASDDRVEKPKQDWILKLDFGEQPSGSRAVAAFEGVAFAYPGRPTLFDGATFDVGYGERVAVTGPNGAGKTTLLRLLAGAVEPTTGRVRLGPSVRPGFATQEHDTLDAGRTVLDHALSERLMPEGEMRAFLHFFLFEGDEVFRRVRECSPGERSRLQLALLVLRGCNLLLLDEPLNHLDIEGREHFEQALDAFECTVIAVAHDRRFLSRFAERIIEVRDGRVAAFEGGYEAYARWSVL